VIVVGYISPVSGTSLEAQRAAIRAECKRRRWDLARIHEDAGIALAELDSHRAAVLIVARSRSLADFVAVAERARARHWGIVALDLNIDTTQFQRRLLGQRIRDALDTKRSQGVRLGRPPVDLQLARRIVKMRKAGKSLTAIADQLNLEAVPTVQGGARWRPSSVRSVLVTRTATQGD
jgi:DNA invertase Pin-like site-specific DNA recombinase